MSADLHRLIAVADHLTAADYELLQARAEVPMYARPAVTQLRAELLVCGRRLENLLRVLGAETDPSVPDNGPETHGDAPGHPDPLTTHPRRP